MGPVNCQEVSRSRNRTLGGQNRRFWLHNHGTDMTRYVTTKHAEGFQ